jgi:16S rRNA (uracil1498-N3)-methyltransferase
LTEEFRLRNVNLILFTPEEIARPLPGDDRRAVHLLRVLRRREGGTFDAGLINGPRGKGTVVAIRPEALTLSFVWAAEPPPLDPITLIVGLPRPQTARDILRDATSLGVAAIHFVVTDKGEPNYAGSTLWTSGEWRRHLVAGAEQAFDTRLPEITHGRLLLETTGDLPQDATRLALDNYEASAPLSSQPLSAGTIAVAFGPERGWSNAERASLREAGFAFGHLGPRVLRVETAITAAVALLKAKRGLM